MTTAEEVTRHLTKKGREVMIAIGRQQIEHYDGGTGEQLAKELGLRNFRVLNGLRDLGLLAYDSLEDWWQPTPLGTEVANSLAGNPPIVTARVDRKWTSFYVGGRKVGSARNEFVFSIATFIEEMQREQDLVFAA